jgi:hypothetical protein
MNATLSYSTRRDGLEIAVETVLRFFLYLFYALLEFPWP